MRVIYLSIFPTHPQFQLIFAMYTGTPNNNNNIHFAMKIYRIENLEKSMILKGGRKYIIM